MACTLIGISTTSCESGRAGISKAWIVPAEDVSALTFGSDGEVTAITMVATKVFVPFVFEKDTAFFNQVVSRNKSNVNVAQTLSMIFPVMNKTSRKALRGLFECACGVIAIVKDNLGTYHVAGINTYPTATPAWETAQMRTGESSGNTGADPNADTNEYVITLAANTNFFAPFSTVLEASIPV